MDSSESYDEGGWLQPGLTLAYNATGVPELVLSAPELDAEEETHG